MQRTQFIIIGIIFIGICGLSLMTIGAGAMTWVALSEESTATPTVVQRVVADVRPTFTPTPSPTETPTLTVTPTSTATPTDTSTPIPPTETPTETPTPPPPTETPPATATPVPPPPTDTPEPTATPVPSYPFEIAEHLNFPTNHPNFDVFIGVTDEGNHPLSGYRVIGMHSSGWQIESAVSAGDWTENSGAMWYKAGNIKYAAPNSPSGTWMLQLVDGGGQPAAPAITFDFQAESPSWYFLLYRRLD